MRGWQVIGIKSKLKLVANLNLNHDFSIRFKISLFVYPL